MALTQGIIFAIIATFGWGIADFFAKKAVDEIGPYRTFFYSYFIGLFPILIYFVFFPNIKNLTMLIIFLFIIEALLNFIGYICFYKGIEIEKLSVIAPIIACNSVIVVLLSIIFLNEVLNLNQGIGVGLMIIGLVFVSIQGKFEITSRKAILIALISMVAWGGATFMFGYLVKQSNWLLAIVLGRFLSWVWGSLFFKVKKVSLSFPKGSVINYIILVAFLELIGVLFFSLSATESMISIIGPIVHLYPVVTLIMARLFLKEKLILYQKIGIAGILIGLVFISI